MKKKLARGILVVLASMTALAGPSAILSAQGNELDAGGCAWTTRWKDIHNQCTTACCDSTQYSCPCTA